MKKVLSLLLAVVMVIGMLPMGLISASAAEVTTLATFELGTNSEAKHVDGSSATEYTETVNGYTLSITSGVKMYTKSYDAAGNSCIKFGTGSAAGSCSFTVPDAVTEVVISVAKYKANATTIDVNGTQYTLENASNDGAYDEITVDTTTTKTVTFATVATTYRAMVNTIAFNGVAADCAHTNTVEVEAVAATCTTAGKTAGVQCADCSMVISGLEAIDPLGHSNTSAVTAPTCTEDGYTTYTCSVCGNSYKSDYVDATGHTYIDGVCSCGAIQPALLTYEKAELSEITADQKVIITMTGSDGTTYAMTSSNGTGSAPAAVAVTVENDTITTDADSIYWNIANTDGSLTIYPDGTTESWLYCTNGNNGVRVGTNENKAFTIDATSGYLTNTATTRYLGVYNAQDWRCYTSPTATNITGQTLGFYVYNETSTDPEPECTHENTELVDDTSATCTTDGYTGDIWCGDCQTVVEAGTTIEALGHSYENGTCTICGEAEPAAPTGSYVLVTNTADLVAGDKVVVVATGADYALSTTQNSNNRAQTPITKNGTTVAIDDTVQVLTLYAGTVDGTWALYTGSGYLYAASSSKNYMRTQATNDANSSWTIVIADNVATIKAQGTNTRNWMRYNSDNGIFSCYSSGQTDISLYRYIDASECIHTVETWTVETAATCEVNGLQTGACTLCGETQTSVIPATGHTLTYGETAITCSNDCDYSQAYTLSTIATAKADTEGTAVYYIKGIVTYVKDTTVYIEDDTGSICVYFTYGTTPDLTVGDEILVWDTITTYKGLIETTNTTASEYVKVSSGNALPSQTVTLANLLADTTNEYLSERVVIEGLTIGAINSSGDTSLTDADGNTINIYKVSDLAENVNANDIVTVTAIVSTYNGYQLLINPTTAATDVVVTEERAEVVVETVTIAEAKAGEAGTYYQVEGVVTYISGRNVYIQDATGGIVVYLTANAATTAIGDKVKAYGALKVYNGLIELDGVDETNTEFYEILSNGNTVDAQAVTISDLTADTTNEYLAEKVTLENIYIVTVNYSSYYKNVTYALSDGTNTIQIYRAPAATEDEVLAVGSIVSVEAIVSSYSGYQLLVVDATKITATGTCPAQIVAKTGDATSGAITYVSTMYMTLQDALNNADPSGSYLQLLVDCENVNVTLDDNIYIDLNGKKLSGTITTDGNTIYGMDSATDGYTCETMGTFNCKDENGNAIAPEAMVKASVNGNKRYLTIATDNGYTFHRFYLGITYATLKPGSKGVGYKASFLGDEMVKTHISSFGFNLQLGGNAVRTVSLTGDKLTKDTFSLVIENYDTETMGLTELSASVFMVIDGETVTTSTYTTTLKTLMETINADTTILADAAKKAALAEWIATSATMQTWEVGNIYTATETGTETGTEA